MEKLLCGGNKNLFWMDCEPIENLNIKNPGYIIRPDGNVVIIHQNEYHDVVISNYLSYYYDDPSWCQLDKINSMIELGKMNHVFFQGYPNSEEIKEHYGQVSVLFSLPMEWNYLTTFQRKSILTLLQSNSDDKQEHFAKIQYYDTIRLLELVKQKEISEIPEKEVLTTLGIEFSKNDLKGYSFKKNLKQGRS